MYSIDYKSLLLNTLLILTLCIYPLMYLCILLSKSRININTTVPVINTKAFVEKAYIISTIYMASIKIYILKISTILKILAVIGNDWQKSLSTLNRHIRYAIRSYYMFIKSLIESEFCL